MDSSSQQIVSAYETLGMDENQIHEAYPEYDIVAIKNTLAAHCPNYRKEEKLFSEEDIMVARNAIKDLIVYSEVDAVKLKAAKLLIDEAKGRNDKKHTKPPTLNVNINLLNEHIEKVRKAIADSIPQKAIDV